MAPHLSSTYGSIFGPGLGSPFHGLPFAFVSWSELVLILLALMIFGIPILFRIARALKSGEPGHGDGRMR